MKLLKKPIFMPAFHGTNHLAESWLPAHYHRSSFIAQRYRAIPEKKYNLISRLSGIGNTLLGWLSPFSTAFHVAIRVAPEQTVFSVTDSDFAITRIDTQTAARPDTAWVPLIKATRAGKSSSDQEKARMLHNHHSLGGQIVLCVGGRAALYPDYLRLVEAAGGCFMSYRGSLENNGDCLNILLGRVNMVICPVDCVSHDDYFAVKRYCRQSGKFCAFLARSSLPVFAQGLTMLILQSHGAHHSE